MHVCLHACNAMYVCMYKVRTRCVCMGVVVHVCMCAHVCMQCMSFCMYMMYVCVGGSSPIGLFCFCVREVQAYRRDLVRPCHACGGWMCTLDVIVNGERSFSNSTTFLSVCGSFSCSMLKRIHRFFMYVCNVVQCDVI